MRLPRRKPDMAPNRTSNEIRAWQRMLSGRRLDLLNPSPLDIEIEDIAHGLARVARWNGQTSGNSAFSVAQHCLVVEQISASLTPEWPDRWKLAALLHDGPEYVIGDLISPFKAAIGLDYRAFENRILQAIHLRFGLPSTLSKSVAAKIKRADRVAAYFEAIRLAGFDVREAERIFGRPRGLPPALENKLSALSPVPVSDAESRFLGRFQCLLQQMR